MTRAAGWSRSIMLSVTLGFIKPPSHLPLGLPPWQLSEMGVHFLIEMTLSQWHQDLFQSTYTTIPYNHSCPAFPAEGHLFFQRWRQLLTVEHDNLNIHVSTTTRQSGCTPGVALNCNYSPMMPVVKSKKTCKLIWLKSISSCSESLLLLSFQADGCHRHNGNVLKALLDHMQEMVWALKKVNAWGKLAFYSMLGLHKMIYH